MRISYLYLKNYIGIFNGLGLDEIEIDMSKAKHKVCLIAGPNGVGKSTIINALHVLPDDNSCFVPGRSAVKKIVFTDDDDTVYTIKIDSICANNGKRTTEAHFSKNGVELNPNGNVTSYKDVAFTEFDIDANFIAMSKISSEDRGLADKTPSERKKMIASRIESLDAYNEMYKSLNKKANIFKSHLNSISSKLQNLGNKDDLVLRLSEIEKSEYAVTTAIDDNKKHLIEAETRIKLLDPSGSVGGQYSDIEKQVKEKNKELENISKKISSLKEQRADEHMSIDKCEKNISQLENEIAGMQGERKQLLSSISELESQISTLAFDRDKLMVEDGDSFTYETSVKAKKEKEKELKTLLSEFNSSSTMLSINDDTNIDTETISRMIKICQDISNVQFEDVTDGLDNAITNEIIDASKDSNSREIDDIIPVLVKKKGKLSAEVDRLSKEVSDLSTEKRVINDSITYIEGQLKSVHVPHKCIVEEEDCSLLDNYRSLTEDKKQSVGRLSTVENNLSKAERDLAKANEEYNNVFSALERLGILKPLINYLAIYADIFDSILSDCSLSASLKYWIFCASSQIATEVSYIAESKKDLYELHNYITSKQRLVSGIDAIDKYIEKHKEMAKNIRDIEKRINSLEKDKEKKLSNIKDIGLSIETASTLISSAKKKLDICKEIESLSSLYSDISSEIDDLSNKIKEIENIGYEISILNNDIQRYQSIVDTAMGRLRDISEEKKRLESQILIWDNFQQEYTEYNEKYNYVNILRKYSSPTQGGIQSLYMSLYMNKTLDLSNEILAMLFNGQYRILDYIINENEFRIPFIGAGMMVDDISSGSTSQKCIMGSIINLVSNSSASPVYNIALLDEVDGGLDQDNRMIFADTILKAADILKISQLISISHSIEASLTNVDVILLSNSQNYIDQFANSNIIYQYKGR